MICRPTCFCYFAIPVCALENASTSPMIACLHHVGPDRWAIHVPLGKLKTERMVPVDSFVCELVQRLRFLRSFDPLPADGRLLARHKAKPTLIKQLRPYLADAAAAVGISRRIVPHQLRHYAASRTMPHVDVSAA